MDKSNPSEATPRTQGTTTDLSALIAIDPPKRKRSFWKRISIRPSVRRAQLLSEESSYDTLVQRLESIVERLSGIETAVDRSNEQLDTRLLQFREMEEQLEAMTFKVNALEKTQKASAAHADILSRRLTRLAFLAVLTAGAALALSLPLGAWL
jgi:DNA repair exonuclease SbcCD ATPase subunit